MESEKRFYLYRERIMIQNDSFPSLIYDPETGHFWWKARGMGLNMSRPAGTLTQNGYIQIFTDGKKHYAHRLAFLFFHGFLPKEEIDHINTNRSDNRIENLREASNSQNRCNTRTRSDNTSGVKGVSFDKRKGLWHARIWMNGLKNQKYFSELKDASNWISSVRKDMHGKFARN